MSNVKHKKIFIAFIMVVFSLFLFGCEQKTPVDDIYFDESNIVLLVGESFTPKVAVLPNYATDRGYTLTSLNTNVVTVSGNTITAVNAGSATIKVTADDNSRKEDYINVQVRDARTTLNTPKNLIYNKDTQTISFDAVDNASSYTIKINGNTIELGNSTSYGLEKYYNAYGTGYDEVLEISVRANPSTYSQAFIASSYTNAIFVYQASSVTNVQVNNGVLTFNKANSNNYLIYINNELFYDGAYRTSYNLTNLKETLAGNSVDVSVIAKAEKIVDDDKITYYNSLPISKTVSVMDICTLNINGTQLFWNNVAYASSYNVIIDGEIVANTSNNYLDLSTLSKYDEMLNRADYYSINVDPIMSEVADVLKTNSLGETKYFNRLVEPTISANDNQIRWSGADSTSYSLTITGNDYNFKTNTTLTSLSLDNYEAGNYTITIQSLGGTHIVDGKTIFMLPSPIGSLNIVKQNEVDETSVKIEDYVLSFDTTINDSYSIKIGNVVSETIEANSAVSTFDLSNYAFPVGGNEITITHLGDGSNVFDSDIIIHSFTQLDNIDAINVQDGVASVTLSDINANADIQYTIFSDTELFSIQQNSWTINTLDNLATDYLSNGDYTIKVKVIGDGSTTFSANRTGKVADYTATADFEVLSAPIITVTDKNDGEISLSSTGASGFHIYNEANEYIASTTTSYNVELISGSITLKVRAIGDGTSAIDSNYSEITLSRLVAPAISYNYETNILTKTDNNDSNLIESYVFKHNDTINTTYTFGTEFTSIAIGDNIFTLKLIAVDENEGVYYLNSAETELVVNKINESCSITVNQDNQLVITPSNQTEQYDLVVTFTIGGADLTFTSNDSVLTDGNYSLNFEYKDEKYYIDLLDDKYSPIIDTMIENFSVKVKFVSDDVVDSNYSSAETIKLCAKSIISREGQYIVFSNVTSTRTIADYLLLVNDTLLDCPNDTIVDSDNQTFKVSVDYITSNVEADVDDIYTIKIVTLNTDSVTDNATLSIVGENAYFTMADELTLTATKDNTSTNNNVQVQFNVPNKEYAQNFILEFYNREGDTRLNLERKTFSASDVVGGVISFNLDKIELLGIIYVDVYISTADSYTADSKEIFVFNSRLSNELGFVKIATVDNIYASDGVLHFDAVENAVGYDIYVEVAGQDEDDKVNTNLITNTEYPLSNISGSKSIKIKAISIIENEGIYYTNSNISEVVAVHKLETPVISANNGNLVVALSATAMSALKDETIDCSLIITNDNVEKMIDLADSAVQINGNTLIIEPAMVLNYGSTIINELIYAKLIANYTDADETRYYLNSNISQLNVKGLLSPSNVNKTTTTVDDVEMVEYITWQPSDNVIDSLSVLKGYIVKIDYIVGEDTIPYLTSDTKLKYIDGTNIKSYSPVITDSKIPFPYGYDEDENGEISDNERFDSGTFRISVKAVPIELAGENLLSSKYSAQYEINIMSAPTIVTQSGVLKWDDNVNATSYLVTIYDNDFTTILAKDIVTNEMFDFGSAQFDEYYGLYGVTIQAQSTNKDVIASPHSDMIKVFRMASGSVVNNAVIDSVDIEDGSVIITANKYFESAELEFIDTVTGSKQTLTYTRQDDAEKELNDLGLTSWDELVDTSVLTAVRQYVITINDSEILNIIEGRSYKINIKLFGNSNSELPIINSRKAVAVENSVLVKLNSNITEVKSGTFKFATSYTDDLNYNFNNQLNGSEKVYWNGIYVYLLTIVANQTSYNIYCVDYNSLARLTANVDYITVENRGSLYAYVKYTYLDNDITKYLYFNVYKDNTIDLNNDYIYYYPINKSVTNGTVEFTSVNDENAYERIDIVSGGSFVLKVALLGGDKLNGTAYLTSNEVSTDPFIRYSANELTSYNGKIKLNDQRAYDNEDILLDNPVYKLTINPLNTTQYSYVYLYYTTEADARLVVDDENGIYREVQYDDYGNIIYDMSADFEPKSYQVKIQTLAGLGVSGEGADYYLDSKEPTNVYVYKKISNADVSSANGVLQTNLSYIIDELGSKVYIYDYEITLTDSVGTDYVYNISRESTGVSIDSVNNILTYNITNTIIVGDSEIDITNGESYTIKLKGITTGNYILNGSYIKDGDNDKTLQFRMSDGIEAGSVTIADGLLKWRVLDLDNYSFVNITLTYLDSNDDPVNMSIKTAGIRSNNIDGEYMYHYYRFEDSKYGVDGTNTTEYIDAGETYTATICVLGNSSSSDAILNSNTTTIGDITRIARVDNTSIKSDDGLLTWTGVENATHYIVNVDGTTDYTYTTTDTTLDMSMADDNGNIMQAGDYTITIRAMGDDCINAMMSSNSTTLTKLATVSNIRIDTVDNSYFIWDAVDKAQGYEVTFSWETDTETSIETTNRIMLPNDLSGMYTVSVRAVGVDEGTVFNGEWSTYTSSTERPNPVLYMEHYTIDELSLGYVWAVADDFSSGDSMIISYNLRPYIYENGEVVLREASADDYHQVTYSYSSEYCFTNEGVRYYYIILSTMGQYTNFSVKVSRSGVSNSASVIGEDIDLHIFSYGSGTTDEPYRVDNATHLLNIKYYTSAEYILTGTIDLTDVDINSRLASENAIIANEFGGVLDGNGQKITGLNGLELNDCYNFALFNSISGATIKNLSVGNTDSTTNIVNIFATSTTNVLQLSLIANNANSATISGVITNNINITIRGSVGGQMYLAGLIAIADNVTVLDSIVNITFNLDATMTNQNSFIGGMVAKATACVINTSAGESRANTTITQTNNTQNNKVNYSFVGGVAGQLIGREDCDYGIYNTSVNANFNVRARWLGAVVGHMELAKISGVTTTGKITNKAIAYTTNIGGIVGYMLNSIIIGSTSNVELEIVISNTGYTIYIGAYAGVIATDDNKSSSISLSDVTLSEITELDGSKITTLGIVGNKSGSNISIN